MNKFVIDYQDHDDNLQYISVQGESAETVKAEFFTALREAIARRSTRVLFQGHDLPVSFFSVQYGPSHFLYKSVTKNLESGHQAYMKKEGSDSIIWFVVEISSLDEWFEDHLGLGQ